MAGGAERYLEAKFGTVQPLIFGHFGEVNRRFLELIDKLAEVVSFQHHRVHGWKNAKAGICRAKAGIMRRISMAVLRETARHVTRGLDVVVDAATPSNDAAGAEVWFKVSQCSSQLLLRMLLTSAFSFCY